MCYSKVSMCYYKSNIFYSGLFYVLKLEIDTPVVVAPYPLFKLLDTYYYYYLLVINSSCSLDSNSTRYSSIIFSYILIFSCKVISYS